VDESVFIHPTALVESDDVGAGTRVWAFAHILAGAVVGAKCKIGDHAFIESGATLGDRVTVKNGCLIWHGVHIGDEVFLGPNVVFTNDLRPRVRFQTGPDDWLETEVRAGASLGANSTILCGLTIGENALVGAGSVVVKDVPSHALVVGNPGSQRGWVCECGVVLGPSLACNECGRTYMTTVSGLTESTARP
jgi:UDP-2-acetamido-3-amino-2,3-dideoxy-glucuronate N-acetyltransferase